MTVDLLNQNNIRLLKTLEQQTSQYTQKTSLEYKKKLGQFFTDHRIANFMAGLFSFKVSTSNKIEVLDCGAGHGILSIALITKLVQQGYKKINLTLYDLDSNIIEILNNNIKSWENAHPYIDFTYKIIQKNFIIDNINKKFDFIISNPPYFKLNKNSPETKVMSHIIHGQPNIYMLFMAKGIDLLKKHGEMVYITPRSFTSGTYFKKFREYLLKNATLEHIHIFNTRKEHFKNENILQETIISKFSKSSSYTITISTSEDSSFKSIQSINISKESIIEKRRNIICLPLSNDEVEILKIFHDEYNTIETLGYKISTGKVVAFRNKEFLSFSKQNKIDSKRKYVPLLWMHNFKNEHLQFPLENKKKEQYIELCKNTKSLLIPNKNYIIIKRFSSKEQYRRINIGYLFQNKLNTEFLGLENHLNYLYKPNGSLSIDEMLKLGKFLSSKEVDQYFRILNGNTQVNATDILNLPIPKQLYEGSTHVMSN
ncbi:Eco57I restriction-modification methylase domain-containing protein [Hydrogenimonas thermophila]|uniref:site-specific DNA-methyltransferase (adenine-specific) n=1 Tax=Hydrogenimonas thermophila TaxID=223786 RepID=A0A1I5LYD4_9BACT|nr:Eco57I restriction-modification methylase domain-containing protein [Hydrogenimonas thermophila]SFP01766.1 adenine-specific DNA-methyltransferase [Hydrogenimonas thermophila]